MPFPGHRLVPLPLTGHMPGRALHGRVPVPVELASADVPGLRAVLLRSPVSGRQLGLAAGRVGARDLEVELARPRPRRTQRGEPHPAGRDALGDRITDPQMARVGALVSLQPGSASACIGGSEQPA